MPKQVDHEARKRRIADAVCRLAGTRGLEAVSLRHVATEAGVSMGQVQHYFATKDEMLLFAFAVISERYEQRIAAAVTSKRTPRTRLRALLLAMLPLDDAGLAEGPVLLAFLARAAVAAEIAAPLRESGAGMRAFLAEMVGSTPDAEREAVILQALVDGLLSQLLVGHIDARTAIAAVDHQLDRVC
ncbi:TetR family transcriptional regulator [Herbihabitans rhizosphaerae]|uniref:TetR family transcriptional regulator n=1 Tax=Herbihabitans rhizosphaerae TaxID=1872711 RepID=A0A4Q7KGT8_9PSEU|nr:TetR family transcriptional regulator C-terminal domain-containing protein [Herbihabitans rhizosphaerae]RZS34080.1 TetR family transcriptional regulator [Herbihabitans rhizosphaerae]